MPLLGFTVFRKEIEDGRKRQTIRMARKHPIKVGQDLYLYWKLRTKQCEKIGETRCSESYRRPWQEIKSDYDVIFRDGFTGESVFQVSNNSTQQLLAKIDFNRWFDSHHQLEPLTLLDIIRWDYPFRNKKEISSV